MAKHIKYILALLFILRVSTIVAEAQVIRGESSCVLNTTYNYYVYSSTYLGYPNWQASGGTVVSQWQNGMTYYADIRWTSTGTRLLKFANYSEILTTMDVYVCSAGMAASVSVSGPVSICSGSSYTYTATPTNGGSPYYVWKVNNVAQQSSSSSTFNTVLYNVNDIVSVTMTSSITCTSPRTATASKTITSATQPTPVTANIIHTGQVCAGLPPNLNPTFTVNITNGGSSPRYDWFRGTTGGTPVDDNQLSGNNYKPYNTLQNNEKISCVVTSNATCISGSATVSSNTITISVTPLASASASSGSICSGSTLYLYGSAGTSYSWSGNGFTSNQQNPVIPNVTTSGTYIFSNGCSSASVPITVLPTPTATISGSTSVCQNSSSPGITFTTTGSPYNPYTFTYKINYGAEQTKFSSGTMETVGVPTGIADTFTYTLVRVSDANNCSSSLNSNAIVTVNALPTPTIITGPSSACANSTGNIYTTQAGMTGYIWTVIGGSGSSTTNTINVTWASAGTGHVKINYTNSNGCTAASQTDMPVTINPLPTPTIITGPSSACANSTGNIYTTQAGMTGYTWTVIGGSGSSTTNTINVTWASAGTGHVKINYINSNGCTAASQTDMPVTINPLPTPTIITGPSSACANSTGNIYTTQAGMTGYAWTVIGGSGSSTTNTINVTWASAGTGHVKINYTNSNGCTAASQTDKVVTINPLPTASISGSTTVCVNSASPNITFTGASGTAPYTFTYKINGGTDHSVTTISGNSITEVVTTETVGTFTYSLVSVHDASSTMCSQAQSGNAEVVVLGAVFTLQPSSANVVPGQNASFSVSASGPNIQYQWEASPNGVDSWISLTGYPAVGYQTNTLTIQGGFSSNTYYRCKVTSDCNYVYSNNAILTTVLTGGPSGSIGSIVANNGVVGAIPGQFSVGATGAATYTIPIECPSGINGMTPSVSLTYNSQAGNGIAGWGWNIAGLSAVTRTPKNVYYDSEAKGIQWNENDNFSLDGSRLFIKNKYPVNSSQLDADSIEYYKESDNSTKIMGYAFGENGPERFKVWLGNGRLLNYSQKQKLSRTDETTDIYIYDSYPNGYHPSSTQILTVSKTIGWYLTSIKDSYGNQIIYSYEEESVSGTTIIGDPVYYAITDTQFQYPLSVYSLINGESYFSITTSTTSFTHINFRVKEIIYAGSEYKINFIYETRSDEIIGYMAGEKIQNSKRLNSISVNYQLSPQILKEYLLLYSINQYSKLEKVQLTGMADEKFNYTVFDWSIDNFAFSYDQYSFEDPANKIIRLNQGYEAENPTFYPGDFNGDGLSDFFVKFYYTKDDSTRWDWAVYLNQGVPGLLPVQAEGEVPINIKYFYIFDNDLDGKSEVYLQKAHTQDGYAYVKFEAYEYNNSTFATNPGKDIILRLWGGTYNDVILLYSDFEGDGKPDLLLLNKDDLTFNNSMQFYYGCNPSSFGTSASYFLLDINGNGKTEVVFLKPDKVEFWEYEKANTSFIKIYTYYNANQNDKFYVGDFNGDGNSDLLFFDTSQDSWSILTSNGSTLLTNIITSPSLTLLDEDYNFFPERFMVNDFNLDGKSDILEIKHTTGFSNNALLFISNGTNFELKLNNEIGYTSGIRYCTNTNYDFNIDCFLDFYTPAYFNLTSNNGFNQIDRIYTGIGTLTNLTYKKSYCNFESENTIKPESSNQYGIYSSGISAKIVSQITNEDKSIEYEFNKPLLQINGKGFLGFSEQRNISTIDTRINSSYTHYSLIRKAYSDKYELVPDTSVYAIDNDTISKSINYFSYKTIDSKYFILPDSAVTFDMLNSTRQVKKLDNYDDYLNPQLIISQSWADGVKEAESIDSLIYSNITTNGKWFLGQLTQKVTRSKRPGEKDYIRRFDYEYYPVSGALKDEYNEKNSPKELKKSYKYDNYGNITSRTSVAPQDIARIDSMTYSANGRFMLTKSDVLENVSVFSYYEVNGLLETETDPNGFITTNFYDDFGRLNKRKFHDDTEMLSSLSWIGEINNAPEGATYFSYKKSSGNSPITVFYDKEGKELRTIKTGLTGNSIYSDKIFDSSERLLKVSLPYFSTSTPLWTEYEYDSYNRLSQEEFPDGHITGYAYSEREITITNISDSTQATIKESNSLGELIKSTDNGGNLVLTKYYSSGRPKEVQISGEIHKTRFTYDIFGNRDTIFDPDAGRITSIYNSYGNLISQTDNIGNTTSYNYDKAGRILTRSLGSIQTTNTYDTDLKGFLDSTTDGYNSVSYDYNDLGQLESQTESVSDSSGTKSLTLTFTYDDFGRPVSKNWSTGYGITTTYNQFGYLENISDVNSSLWEATNENALGQITEFSQGSLATTVAYNDFGDLQSMVTPGIRDVSYGFDGFKNLQYRSDNLTNQKEVFNYDNLNRLNNIHYYLNEVHQTSDNKTINYNSIGNIIGKTGIATEDNIKYGENNFGPYALTSIDSSSYNPYKQAIGYTVFNKVEIIIDTISGDTIRKLEFKYGFDQQRKKSLFTEGSTAIEKFFFGDYEEVNNGTSVNKYFYINSPSGLCGIYVIEGLNPGKLYRIFTDHLGSLTEIVGPSAGDTIKQSFDAWGNKRSVSDWRNEANYDLFASRGFTGHEHLEVFGLINMNGRVYDPVLGRFLSPDPYVQIPDYSQSLNRYSYCLNNPLIITDPSGELSTFWKGMLFAPLGMAALSPGIKYATGQATIGQAIGDYVVNAALFVAFAPIGGGTFVENVAWGAGEGAIAGGLNAAIYGENIGKGMLNGAAIGGAFAGITSENMSNLFKGEGFYTNENVFNNMMGRGMGKQEILDYFGFEGKYDPSNSLFKTKTGSAGAAITDPVTGEIFYNDGSFTHGFDRLSFNADHELIHSKNVLSGKYKDVIVDYEIAGKEEWSAYLRNYKRQGFYPEHGVEDIVSIINKYGLQGNVYEIVRTPTSFYSTKFNKLWWHFLYRIPRRF